jgi:hypothetical protein
MEKNKFVTVIGLSPFESMMASPETLGMLREKVRKPCFWGARTQVENVELGVDCSFTDVGRCFATS